MQCLTTLLRRSGASVCSRDAAGLARRFSASSRNSSHYLRRSEGHGGRTTSGSSESSDKGKGPLGWRSLLLIVPIGAGCLAYAEYLKHQQEQRQQETKVLPSVGRPSLGGDWILIDKNHKIVTSDDLRGQWLLMYFGFTFCPDICPNELAKITDAINLLDKRLGGPLVTPVFISIDPERDTPEQVGEYIKDWHPRFVALTGSTAQVSEVCKKFRVYYNKAPTGDAPTDYLVDHSIITYLMNPQGSFVDFFGKNKSAPEIVDDIVKYVQQYGAQEKP